MGGRSTPLLRSLAPTVHELDLPRQPFQRLIEANRQDQRQAAYETFDELVGYCELSANPVGELVLHVFGAATPDLIVLSDRVCTALQLAEHWQDVAEDYRNGRIYLPGEDRRRFGVADAELAAPETGAALRRLLEFEVARARDLLDSGREPRRAPARPGAARGGRLRRRRAGDARRDRRDRLRRRRRRPAGEQRPACPADPSHLGEGPMSASAVAPAYEHCRRLARESGSSFYTGMRLLPPDRRAALFAVYALARRIDDIADGDLEPAAKLAELNRTRELLTELDSADDPVLVAVADAARRFPIPLEAFGDLVDGAELDVLETECVTFADLERYARCVAGSIGRLALGVFDCSDRERGSGLADDLGVALQIGNTLRDVREDLENGRVYLPREDLERFGCTIRDGELHGPDRARARLRGAARALLARARPGPRPAPRSPQRRLRARHGRASTGACSTGSPQEPALALRGRLSLRPWEKGLVLARSLTGSGA